MTINRRNFLTTLAGAFVPATTTAQEANYPFVQFLHIDCDTLLPIFMVRAKFTDPQTNKTIIAGGTIEVDTVQHLNRYVEALIERFEEGGVTLLRAPTLEEAQAAWSAYEADLSNPEIRCALAPTL